MILIRDQHYTMDNPGIGIYVVEDEVILIRDQHYTVDNKVILIRESALCCGWYCSKGNIYAVGNLYPGISV